jgi:hypothetical protein
MLTYVIIVVEQHRCTKYQRTFRFSIFTKNATHSFRFLDFFCEYSYETIKQNTYFPETMYDLVRYKYSDLSSHPSILSGNILDTNQHYGAMTAFFLLPLIVIAGQFVFPLFNMFRNPSILVCRVVRRTCWATCLSFMHLLTLLLSSGALLKTHECTRCILHFSVISITCGPTSLS